MRCELQASVLSQNTAAAHTQVNQQAAKSRSHGVQTPVRPSKHFPQGYPQRSEPPTPHLRTRLLVHRKRPTHEANRDAALLALGRNRRLKVEHAPASRERVISANRAPVVRVVGVAAVAHAKLVPVTLPTFRRVRITRSRAMTEKRQKAVQKGKEQNKNKNRGQVHGQTNRRAHHRWTDQTATPRDKRHKKGGHTDGEVGATIRFKEKGTN